MGNASPFPYTFSDEKKNLNYSISVDIGKQAFTLHVNGTPFEHLPLRVYPIKIKTFDDGENRLSGTIILNGLEIPDNTFETENFINGYLKPKNL